MEIEKLKKAKELEYSINNLKKQIAQYENFDSERLKYVTISLYNQESSTSFSSIQEEPIPSDYFVKFMHKPMIEYMKKRLVELEKELDNL